MRAAPWSAYQPFSGILKKKKAPTPHTFKTYAHLNNQLDWKSQHLKYFWPKEETVSCFLCFTRRTYPWGQEDTPVPLIHWFLLGNKWLLLLRPTSFVLKKHHHTRRTHIHKHITVSECWGGGEEGRRGGGGEACMYHFNKEKAPESCVRLSLNDTRWFPPWMWQKKLQAARHKGGKGHSYTRESWSKEWFINRFGRGGKMVQLQPVNHGWPVSFGEQQCNGTIQHRHRGCWSTQGVFLVLLCFYGSLEVWHFGQ